MNVSHDELRNNLLLKITTKDKKRNICIDKLSDIITVDIYQADIIKYVYECFKKRENEK